MTAPNKRPALDDLPPLAIVWMTSAEAAIHTRFSERTIERRAEKGILTKYKNGHQNRYKQSDLDAMMLRQDVKQAA
jgi:hypothetical protein